MTDSHARVPRGFAGSIALGLVGLVATLAAQPSLATILLFDQQRDAATQSIVGPTTSGGRLPQDYGDNVTGGVMAVPGGFFTYGEGGEGFTPDVTLDIFSAAATATDPRVSLWQTDYGDLVNSIFGQGPGTGGAPTLSVQFTASPGFVVDLYGFDLGGWNNTDYTIAAVEVFSGATTLFSQTNVAVEGNFIGPRHTTFAFAQPLSGSDLLLRLDLSNLASGLQDNIGIDSIRFGQTPPPIPEPSTAVLLACGLLLIRTARPTRGEARALQRT